jgi:hypothetical protein
LVQVGGAREERRHPDDRDLFHLPLPARGREHD